MPPPPCKLTFDFFDLESGVPVTCDVAYLSANFSLPPGLSVLDLGPMYATDRQTSDAHHRLMHFTLGVGHNKHPRLQNDLYCVEWDVKL